MKQSWFRKSIVMLLTLTMVMGTFNVSVFAGVEDVAVSESTEASEQVQETPEAMAQSPAVAETPEQTQETLEADSSEEATPAEELPIQEEPVEEMQQSKAMSSAPLLTSSGALDVQGTEVVLEGNEGLFAYEWKSELGIKTLFWRIDGEDLGIVKYDYDTGSHYYQTKTNALAKWSEKVYFTVVHEYNFGATASGHTQAGVSVEQNNTQLNDKISSKYDAIIKVNQVKGYTPTLYINNDPVTLNNNEYTLTYGRIVDDVSVSVVYSHNADVKVESAPWEYDGKYHNLISVTGEYTANMQYKLNDGSYSSSIPQAKDAGTYTVYYKSTDGTAVEESSVKVTVTPAQIETVELKGTGANNPKYDATEKSVTVSSINGISVNKSGYTVNDPSMQKGTNAGTYRFRVIGKDNFKGYKDVSWTINKAETPVTATWSEETTYTYNGKSQHPTITLNNLCDADNGKYSVQYLSGVANSQFVDAGTYTNLRAVVIFSDDITDNYSFNNGQKYGDSVTWDGPQSFRINKQEVTLKWGETNFTYNGLPQKPADPELEGLIEGDSCDINVTVLDGSGKLDIGHADAGDYTAIASLQFRLIGGDEKNYKLPTSEESRISFKIIEATLDRDSLIIAPKSFDYDKNEHTSIPISFQDEAGNTFLWALYGGSFNITNNKGTNAGEYTLTITAKDHTNFKGSASADWGIYKRSIGNASFEAFDTVYNGQPQTPNVIGHIGDLITGDTLVLGDDFTIKSATRNGEAVDTNDLSCAGTYTLTLEGKDKYEGEKIVSWTIKPASLDMTVNAKSDLTYNGEAHDLVDVRVTQETINPGSITKTYIVKKVGENFNLLPPDASDPAWDSATDVAKATDAGYYAVYCKATSTDTNYKPTVGGALVRIGKAELSKDNVTLVKTYGDDYVYNGEEHTVSVVVTIDGNTITDGDWYLMPTSVRSAANAGTYHVYISATLGGNFKDDGIAIDKTWTIDCKDIGKVNLDKMIAQNKIIRTYNGLPQQPLVSDLILSDLETDEQLYVTKDFLAEIEPRIDAGTYSFKIYGTGNYTGSKDIEWEIEKAAITSVVGVNTTFGYDGEVHRPTFLVYSSEAGILPLAATSYKTTGDTEKTEVGSYTLKVEGKDNFTGLGELRWEIVKGLPSFEITPHEVEYTGYQIDLVSAEAKNGVRHKKPQFKFIVEKIGEGAIADIVTNKYGVDSDAWNTASRRARATDAGYYAVFYKVYGDKNHKDITGCVISRITKATLTEENVQLWPNEFTYDGSDKSTKVYVRYNGKKVSGEDYYIVNVATAKSVLAAKDAGTYHVYVSATLGGNFTDEGIAIDKTWTIKKAVQTGKVNINSWVWCDTPSTPWMTDLKEDANVTYEYAVRGTDVENGEWSKTQPSAIGAYTVRATIDETKNYEKAVVSADFSIGSLYYKALTIEPIAEQLYTGNEIKPGIVVKHGGYTLKEGSDYTITYSNNVEPGTAMVKVVFVGYYYGTYTTTFDIYGKPGTVMTVKAKTLKGPAVQLTWSKIEGAEKYVVYGNKCGKKYKKLKTTAGNTFNVKKISGKKLVAHKSYKFYVIALDAEGNKLAQTKSIHYVVQKTKGNIANATKVTVSKKNVVLNVGKTSKIKAKVKIYKNKKHLAKNHGAELRFTSNNTDVATVDNKGVITAVRPGSAKIVVQYVSGAKTTVQVTVR